MIAPKELHHNGYYNLDGRIVQAVLQHDLFHVIIGNNDPAMSTAGWATKLDAIPITAELLGRIEGFTFNYSGDGIYEIRCDGEVLVIDLNHFGKVIWKFGRGRSWTENRYIDYTHQLQILYLALSGKELEFSLKGKEQWIQATI